MRFTYSCLALAVLLACENESTNQHLDTSAETESAAPGSTTDSAEPVSPTSTAPTEGVEPNNAEDSTTGDTGTTVFTGTEAVDPDEPAGSSTTLFESDTDDTACASATEPASDTEEPGEETSAGSDPQPCVGAASPVKAEVLAYLESQIVDGDTGGEPGRLYLRLRDPVAGGELADRREYREYPRILSDRPRDPVEQSPRPPACRRPEAPPAHTRLVPRTALRCPAS